MDKVGGGSTSPVVGPGGREDKCIYLGPQVEAEYDVKHRAHERST
jgi:hypothetical protein